MTPAMNIKHDPEDLITWALWGPQHRVLVLDQYWRPAVNRDLLDGIWR